MGRCLDKRPGERYQSAGDLAHDLKALVTDRDAAGFAARPRRRKALLGLWVGLGVVAMAGLLWLLDVGGLRSRTGREPGVASIRSLAVLPLVDLSGDPEQEYFADGMTDALIADLAKIGSLKVISRTSVMRFKGTTKPLTEIAAELDVDAVIEGTVVRSGDRVRITAQLIDATTDHHLWAESYERALTDVLSLQSEIARAIAENVQVVLSPAEQQSLAAQGSVDPEAYEAYLMGQYHSRKATTEGARLARRYFETAIAKDPTSALAHAGLSRFYVGMGRELRTPDQVESTAEAAALRALELDDSLAEAHLALGEVRFWLQWRWEEGERGIVKAIELNSGLAEAHHALAHCRWMTGHAKEGLAESKRYVELDPLSPGPHECLGWHYILAGQYQPAIDSLERALELDPDYYFAHTDLAAVYTLQGKYEDAASHYRAAREISDETFDLPPDPVPPGG